MEYEETRNSTNFPSDISEFMNKISEEYKSKPNETLHLHQAIVLKHIQENNPRGLLLLHGMGLGKTRTMASIITWINIKEPQRKIIIMAKKLLENEIAGNIELYARITHSRIPKYKYVSLNSGRVADQLIETLQTYWSNEEDKKLLKKLGLDKTRKDMLKEKLDFSAIENSLIVVDEAHNLFSTIIHGSQNGILIYDMIMRAKDIKLIFATGSVMTSSVFQLAPCVNMLSGKVLLPEAYHEFASLFLNEDKTRINLENIHLLENRLIGLVSYYGSRYQEKQMEEFAIELPWQTIKVEMSKEQYEIYHKNRVKEDNEYSSAKIGAITKASKQRFGKADTSSSYHIATRQNSNWVFPPYAMEEALIKVDGKLKKVTYKYVDKIKSEDLTKNLSKWSPKIKELLNNINSKMPWKQIICTHMVHGEGIEILSAVLVANGWTLYNKNTFKYDADGDSDNEDTLTGGAAKQNKRSESSKQSEQNKHSKQIKNKLFGVISGIIKEDVSTIKNAFNNNEDFYLLLISPAAFEGLSTKRARFVHIFDPGYVYLVMKQAVYRAIRMYAHEDLKKEYRNVQTYVYISSYKDELCTDEEIYNHALNVYRLIEEFTNIIIRCSIDCTLHTKILSKELRAKIGCKVCLKTSKKLFGELAADMQQSDRCATGKDANIKTKPIKIDKETFYYTGDIGEDSFAVYKYNKVLEKYTKMDLSDDMYERIYSKLISTEKKGGGDIRGMINKIYDF